jgi:hypothetical protein
MLDGQRARAGTNSIPSSGKKMRTVIAAICRTCTPIPHFASLTKERSRLSKG